MYDRAASRASPTAIHITRTRFACVCKDTDIPNLLFWSLDTLMCMVREPPIREHPRTTASPFCYYEVKFVVDPGERKVKISAQGYQGKQKASHRGTPRLLLSMVTLP